MAEQHLGQSMAVDAAVSEFQTSFHALCNKLQLPASPPQSPVQQRRRQAGRPQEHPCPVHRSPVDQGSSGPLPLAAAVQQQIGSRPNIYFCAVPHSHLRGHPFYVPLPHPCTVCMCTRYRTCYCSGKIVGSGMPCMLVVSPAPVRRLAWVCSSLLQRESSAYRGPGRGGARRSRQ